MSDEETPSSQRTKSTDVGSGGGPSYTENSDLAALKVPGVMEPDIEGATVFRLGHLRRL
jgi:hypothetical protein